MLDENGKYKVLSLNDALTLTLKEAENAGVEVPSGSVEDQINNWLAQNFVELDSALYALYVKQFNPTGTDIDLQNPGTPRLTASKASGYLKLDNQYNPSPVSVTSGMSFVAPNGNIYTNGTNVLTVPAGQIKYVSVTSEVTGSAQNLPAMQSFSSSLGIPVTNPQPFVDARDTETDTQYLSRLIYNRSNNTSSQATPAAIKELLQFYKAARIYVNNTSNDYTVPVPVPSGGYLAVILLPSGVTAGNEEIQNAINVLASRFEFGNILKVSTTLHPLILGVVYTGTFPQTFSIAVAQVVEFTLSATLLVSFSPGTDSNEKKILSSSFATQFVQNLVNYYGGSAGYFNLSFQESGSPAPSPVNSTPPVLSGEAVGNIIAPVISVEQIRAFISDENTAGNSPNLFYLSCNALNIVLDTNEIGEVPKILDIDAPASGHLSVVDFLKDNLFSDNSSYYDRYIYIDPSKISITVVEQ